MNYTRPIPTSRPASVLAYLRGLVPQRPLSFTEAKHITELQANRLRGLLDITTAELSPEVIPGLPRIQVIEVSDLPASGASQWSDGKWVIAVNGQEPWQRQRFSMGHELWHIINYRTTDFLCPGNRFTSSNAQAEQLADYFSGCLHMPKQHLKRLVGEGLDAAGLADTFGVSVPAVTVRLNQIGFGQSRGRCSHQARQAKGVAA